MYLYTRGVSIGGAGVAIAPPLFGRLKGAAGSGASPHYYWYYYLPPHFKKLLPTACLFAKEKLYIISFLFTNLIWAGNCKNFIKMKAKMIPKSHTVPQILRSSKADFLFDPDPMIFRSNLGVERRRLCRRAETITSWVQWF